MDTGWGTPVELSDNIAVTWNRFDAVLDPEYNSYITYLYDKTSDLPELRVSKNFEAPQTASINLPVTDTLNYFTLHCDEHGVFTMYLWIKNKNIHVTFSYDCLNWTDPIEIPDDLKNYFGGLMVRTDTRQGYFTNRARQIVAIAGNRAAYPYGPDTLFYGDIRIPQPTSVDNIFEIPINYSLNQNYPNPFNPSTKISFSIPEQTFVELKIYNILGIEIEEIISKELPAGSYTENFDASQLSSGIYFYKLNAGKYSDVKKMTFIK